MNIVIVEIATHTYLYAKDSCWKECQLFGNKKFRRFNSLTYCCKMWYSQVCDNND